MSDILNGVQNTTNCGKLAGIPCTFGQPATATAVPVRLDPDNPQLSSIVRRGDTVAWGQASAEPLPLTRALMAQRHAIGSFRVFLGVTVSDTCLPEHADCVEFVAYCGSGANRALANAGALDILPCHYHQLPALIESGGLPIDVLLLQVAVARHGHGYSLACAHEYLIAALDRARVVVAEVNDQAPWTYGERYLGENELDFVVHTSRPPLPLRRVEPGATELAIARHACGLIEDGATLQVGLGAIPEAILGQLRDHVDIGVHSGTIGDGVADLMESGVITNARKSIDTGLTIAGVMMGSRRIFDFAHRNPALQFRSTRYTHDPDVLARIDRFVALNSAIEVDLTGQVNAETANGTYLGAVGGATDFLRGAWRSKGGLPIVALPASAGTASRIVSRLNGPVSVARSDAAIVITEHGVADLRGLSLSQRVHRMLAIADPDFREALEREAAGGRRRSQSH